MALETDPYRTLGLARGATIDEVKRAYRRLAKANHPDAAGAAALPRFLAIQAAYEQLVEGRVSKNGRQSSGGPRRPWDADPTRSDATRRAYGSRGRPASPGPGGPSGSGSRPAGGGAAGTSGPGATGSTRGAEGGRASWSTRTRTRTSGGAGSAGSGGAGSRGTRSGSAGAANPGANPGAGDGEAATGSGTAPGGSRRRSDRPRKKATFGSTSYDGVDGPFEPDWGGASWYGTTSGTYWTLNPKEYADPRKHGPEYQARARRAARPWPPGAAATPGVPGSAEQPPDIAPPPEPDPGEPIGPSARPTHTTTSWWDSTAGRGADPDQDGDPDLGPTPAAAPGSRPRPTDRRDPAPAVPATPSPDLGRALADIGRALTDTHYGGWRGRVVRAVIGWLPIALGIGWLIGELTGCGRFAATCDGSAGPIALTLQIGVLAVLLAVPVLASLTTMASLTVLGASLIAALILSATGSAADADSRRVALGFVLVVAWLVGLAVAIWRRWGTVPAPTRPVS
jgi:hypothetical protein